VNDISVNPDSSWLLLTVRRLPARLNVEQAARVLGFQPHDIPALVKAGLLRPLGSGPRNCVKYFPTVEVQNAAQDRKWLDKATRAVSRCKPASKPAKQSEIDSSLKHTEAT
jgi:hypothetical protein